MWNHVENDLKELVDHQKPDFLQAIRFRCAVALRETQTRSTGD
ncbi:MAG: hypothetical protein ACRD7E_18565 [Bryobacteraceae bacterium]